MLCGHIRVEDQFRKSELVPIGEVENVDNLAHILGCRVASLPMSYLVCRWERLLKVLLFVMESLRKWNVC
jgi:hypothetical protein